MAVFPSRHTQHKRSAPRRTRECISHNRISHSSEAHRAVRTASPVRAILWRWRWVICALVFAVIIQSLLSTLAANDPRTIPIVVANADLSTGDELTASNTRVDSVPSEYAPEGVVTELDQALGETIVAPLPEGAPIFSQQFLTSAFSSSAPPGRVVTAISLDDNSTLDILQAGDTVKLYSPPSSASLDSSDSAEATLLTNNAVVMSIKAESEGGGLLGTSESAGVVFVAIVEKDANLVIGSGAHTPLHAVITSR